MKYPLSNKVVIRALHDFIMEEFEVVGYYSEPKAAEKEYFVAAINYRLPSYVKIVSKIPLRVGVIFQVDGDSVYLENFRIGNVKEKRSSRDVEMSVDFDPRYTGGYSIDGKTVFLDEHFPIALFVDGIMVSTIETIGLHHELPEKWLIMDGFNRERAHIIAFSTERKYVESLGVRWGSYCKEVELNLKKIYGNLGEKKELSSDTAHYLYCREKEIESPA